MRRTGPPDGPAVLCLDGGVFLPLRGDWSASIRYLVRRLAPAHPGLAFHEVRYRIRSWRRLEMCVEDARAALAVVTGGPPRPVLLLGYSMGGAVAIAVASDPAVTTFVGLAPWIPDAVDVAMLGGRRVAVIHGSIDGRPGGVAPARSRRAVERMRALGVDASYRLLPGALHALALAAPGGRLVPMPRARAWARLVDEQLRRFEATA
jgi:pimeloyl-ACP methyl ester carboxylesterase